MPDQREKNEIKIENFVFFLDNRLKILYYVKAVKISLCIADMAQSVERILGKDEVGSSNLPSSSKKASKTSVFDAFCCKNAEKCEGQNVGQPPDPHRDPHAKMCG